MELKTMWCPLTNGEVPRIVCLDIHMVVDGISPLDEAPPQVLKIENFREICLACPQHRDD